jgi:transglutaminase-like putative cysteine protease
MALVRRWVVWFIWTCTFAMCLLVPASAERDPSVSRASVASWVDMLPIPEPRPKRMREVEDGRYYLLEDSQIRVTDTGEDYYYRQVSKVLDRSGLEDSAQRNITFDPSSQQLVLNKASIWREGKEIDGLDSATIEVLRREDSLEDGILTGERTAVVRLKDVRVGDLVDLAWSWVEPTTLWPGEHFSIHSLGWSVPVGLTRVRILTPDAVKLHTRMRNTGPEVTLSRIGTMNVSEWRAVDPDPIAEDEKTPDGFDAWPELSVSTIAGWRQAVDWTLPRYGVDPSLPPDFAAKLDGIAKAVPDPADRAVRALRLVQDQVRYTSLSIGAGGFTPRAPAETLRNGFGDCKDKSILLVAALKRLGIDAFPALTDIDEGPALEKRLPAIDAFDHVIVGARIGGRTRWFDATQSAQGGMGKTLADLPYGFALPIRPGQSALEAIPNSVPPAPTLGSVETFKRLPDGLSLVTVTAYSGDEADVKRASLLEESLTKAEQSSLDFYQEMYPGLRRVGDFVTADDRDRNVISVTERYFLPSTADDFDETLSSFQTNASTLRDLFVAPKAHTRHSPLSLPFTINRSHKIIIVTPDSSPTDPGDAEIDGDAFSYKRSVSHDAGRLIIAHSLLGKTASLVPEKFAEFRKDADALERETYAYIDLTSSLGGANEAIGFYAFALLAFAAFGTAAIVLWVQAFARVQKMEMAAPDREVFHPVGPLRFVALLVSTFGIYSVYWFWRCWRQHRLSEKIDCWP